MPLPHPLPQWHVHVLFVLPHGGLYSIATFLLLSIGYIVTQQKSLIENLTKLDQDIAASRVAIGKKIASNKKSQQKWFGDRLRDAK